MLFLCFGDSGDMRFMDYWLFFALLFLFVSIFFSSLLACVRLVCGHTGLLLVSGEIC